MNHPLIATAERTCLGCPEQYEGQLRDGRYFYYRFRWGTATLGLGATIDEAVADPFEAGAYLGDDLRGFFNDDWERDNTFGDLLEDRIGARG
jgi:hypothetical protein